MPGAAQIRSQPEHAYEYVAQEERGAIESMRVGTQHVAEVLHAQAQENLTVGARARIDRRTANAMELQRRIARLEENDREIRKHQAQAQEALKEKDLNEVKSEMS